MLPSYVPRRSDFLMCYSCCRAVAISAATRGVLDRQTALALKPAIDQIGEVLDEVMVLSASVRTARLLGTYRVLLV